MSITYAPTDLKSLDIIIIVYSINDEIANDVISPYRTEYVYDNTITDADAITRLQRLMPKTDITIHSIVR